MPAPTRPTSEKIILILASVHLLFLAGSILPVKWRDAPLVSGVFRVYQSITRCHQNWTMFESIPTMHHLEARLVVREEGQKSREEGMLLPGLRRYPRPENARLYSWVDSVAFAPSMAVFRESYMKKAATELLRTGRYRPKAQLSFEVIPAYTRSLAGVRELREIAVERPSVLGPFELSALVSGTPRAN